MTKIHCPSISERKLDYAEFCEIHNSLFNPKLAHQLQYLDQKIADAVLNKVNKVNKETTGGNLKKENS